MPDRTCSHDGCTSPHLAKGYCRKHYQRLMKGAPLDDAPKVVKLCTVDACEAPSRTRQMCKYHYQEWWIASKRGPQLTRSDRFWAKVNKNGPLSERRPDLGPCWLWTGALSRAGYGSVGKGGGKIIGAHVWSYEEKNGPVPEGLEVDHLCYVVNCVRPEHLEAVTPIENKQRSWGYRKRNTHCKYGHLWTAENTSRNPNGARLCRRCRREQYAARRSQAASPPEPSA